MASKGVTTKDLVLIGGLVLVGGIAAVLVLRPTSSTLGAGGGGGAPGTSGGGGGGGAPGTSGGGGGGGAPGTSGGGGGGGGEGTVLGDPCAVQANRNRLLAERDAAHSELVKVDFELGPGGVLVPTCKNLTGLAGLAPLVTEVCISEATEYVRTGNRANYYGNQPTLRDLHVRYTRWKTAYDNAANALKKAEADLAALAKAGKTCTNTTPTTPNPPTTNPPGNKLPPNLRM